ncbi:MAG: hypothetical protein ACYTAN_10810 [Planctomycetota bacterium]
MKCRPFLACLLAFAVLSAVAFPLSKEEVYYGNHRQYKKAAEVNAKKVFVNIPAYKEIIDKDIDEDSALYLIKLAEANRIFLEAVKEFAKDKGYDLICEEGALEDAPCVTAEVVKIVKDKTHQ